MADTLYIVDTFSLVFQVYHAIRQPMTGTRGQPTNAVFGFTGDLEHLLHDKRPTHLVLAMESPTPQKRVEMYEAYKAHREEMPEDLRPQIPMILDVVRAYRIPVIACDGWEADDVLATLATQAAARGMDVRIVTNDKDARQLIGPRVKLYSIRKRQFYEEAELQHDWGIRPDQVIDFQALVGDSVDNVPGVPQVGPKTATQLLQQFGTLEGVLAHPEQAKVRSKTVLENLTKYADQARLSRELVTLRTDLPLDIDWDALRVEQPDWKELYRLFTDFGFRRHANDAHLKMTESAGTLFPDFSSGKASPGGTRRGKKASQSSTSRGLFPAAAAAPEEGNIETGAPEGAVAQQPFPPAPSGPPRAWEAVRTWEAFESFVARLEQQPVVCFDLETTSARPLEADIVGWAFCWEAGQAWYVPVQGPPGEAVLEPARVLERLRPWLVEGVPVRSTLFNQNVKYDLLVLRRAGVVIDADRLGLDTMIGDYLLDAGARTHGLDELARKHLQWRKIPTTDLIGTGKNQKSFVDVPVDRVAEYASEDADVAWRLAALLEGRLREQALWDLYWTLERPLISVLTGMEAQGVRLDVEELKRQSDQAADRLQAMMGEIYALAGREFNANSPKQLATILFDELKLPIVKRTKTGPSTDEDVLEQLAAKHPLPAKMIEHRMLSKLKGTYLDALPGLVNPHTGRLHTSYSQVSAATGRLASSEPNLQNIPIRTPEGQLIRKAFIPSAPGWKLVSLDYSQIELRILAHFCQDPALLQAFRDGVDVHALVASQVFHTPVEQVDPQQRRIAKAVNFGVIYGQTAFGLSAALGISKEEAQQFIDEYFARYAAVHQFIDRTLADCLQTGFARTILGRRREIDGVRPERSGNLNLPERTAVNTVIQGSAADLIKQAMLRVHARLDGEAHPGRMLLQIHDELLFECPAEQTESLVSLARDEMERALELNVPVVVDVGVGDNWLEAK